MTHHSLVDYVQVVYLVVTRIIIIVYTISAGNVHTKKCNSKREEAQMYHTYIPKKPLVCKKESRGM